MVTLSPMNQQTKYYVYGAIGLAVVVGLIWWGSSRQQSLLVTGEPIKVGYVGPLSGPVAYTGEPVVDAIRLASEQLGAASNRPIEIIYEDGVCDNKTGLSAAQKLMDVDQVNILISGVCSGVTLAIAPIAEERGVILISPVAASPAITGAGDYTFRTSGSSVLIATQTAEQIKSKFSHVGILFENNEYPVGWKDSFIKAFSGDGRAVFSESFSTGDTDVRSQLQKLNSQGPDAIFLIGITPPGANNVLKQYTELGFDTPLVGNELFSFKSIIANHTQTMEGMLIPTYTYDLSSRAMQKLLSDYKERYSKDLLEEVYGALAYDMYGVLHEAIEQCEGDDPECIKKELYGTRNFQGISGDITIDKNGDTERDFVVRQIKDGVLTAI